MITWEPRRAGIIWGPPLPGDVALLDDLAEGRLDAYVRQVANTLRASGQPVLLRFAHEMDLERDGLHPWAGGDPALYQAAWRRVHATFQAEGATNVRFLWSPGGVITPWDGFVSDAWYPGDDVVDLVGFSAFAAWQWEEWSAQRASVHAFRTPRELLLPRYEAIAAHGKPVVLPEVGVQMHPSLSYDEARWIEEFSRFVTSDEVPLMRGVVYFNAPHNLPDYEIDWGLNVHEREVIRSHQGLRGYELVRP